MGKFLKIGRVVLLLQGRQAGKKAIIVKSFDEGSKARPYGHVLVAGIESPPRKVTKRMSKKKQLRRSKVSVFLKYVNFKHIMPTRYMIPHEIDPRKIVTDEQMNSKDGRKSAKSAFKTLISRKFSYPPMDKNGAPSKDVLFLKKKLRF